uniref:Uncharacterized protein n=1 Tax=Trieres chinensis TaxID=1514140 RepID=A0A7S2AAT6_TRICV|mmetsp:Transcript_957/g.1955  ORF Transcript_957/g.1955 Transcript_957/m.1955 type:complete len:224 (+) Transcript_957:121-792(+)|eukprot:CAMPEP_0183296298 /NCGR_PEP_ID=MMETSP0160_2-20130417/3916_1 /TAXON_ID=2839 ORGANISM="Odontella Sinensis, Strain Grunow 1884" /NCGR_SAMPLE_ID=MMETSP0160_2 /ASSEMBLY_ACC=CAM_ASM_000250 /LENGTH=223 /DNA_ID=CAMNT_0025457901 /DNA_START=107 /DNA_END=778 /DNA_ORIENTATION=+
MYKSAAVALLLASVGVVSGFAPAPNAQRSETSLSMFGEGKNGGKTFAAAALTSAYLLTGLLTVEPALASPDMGVADFGGSSVLLSGRSGGRAGGRASSSASSARSSAASSQTVIKKTTVIQQPVYSSPAVVVGSPMYSPMYSPIPTPGLGLYAGLAAVDAIGDGIREARQENEIRQTRAELRNAKEKEFEMEQRMRQLEMSNQQMQINQQVQQQMAMQAAMKP